MVSLRSIPVLLPALFILALAAGPARAEAPAEPSLAFSETPPLSRLKVGTLTSSGRSTKKFAGTGTLTFLGDVEIDLDVVARNKVNKKHPARTRATYILKSPRGALPRVRVKFVMRGGALSSLSVSLKAKVKNAAAIASTEPGVYEIRGIPPLRGIDVRGAAPVLDHGEHLGLSVKSQTDRKGRTTHSITSRSKSPKVKGKLTIEGAPETVVSVNLKYTLFKKGLDGVSLRTGAFAIAPLSGVVADAPGVVEVRNSLSSAPVGSGGTFTINAFAEGRQLAMGATSDGTLLLGWLGEGRTTLSARSTAEVMLFVAGSMFTVPLDRVDTVIDEIAASQQAADLAVEVEAALWSGASTFAELVADVAPQLSDLTDQLIADAGGKSLLIDPIAGSSGIDVSAEGFQNVVITNYYRRRAHAFIQRLGHTPEDGIGFIQDEADLTDVVISPSPGISSVIGLLISLGSGAYTPVEKGPFTLPLTPDRASSTLYKVTVVGLGFSQGDFGQLNQTQRTWHARVAIETIVLDIIGPWLAAAALPSGPQQGMQQVGIRIAGGGGFDRFTAELLVAVPLAAEQAAGGDFTGAIGGILTALNTDDTLTTLFTVALAGAVENVLGKGAAEGVTGFMAKFALEVLAPLDISLKITDTVVQGLHIAKSNNADVWNVEVTSAKVSLVPEFEIVRNTSGRVDQPVFEAIVQDGEELNLTYKWSCGDKGRIGDTKGHFGTEFESSDGQVVFTPDVGAEGTTHVTVEVEEIVGSGRRPIGKARAKVEIIRRTVLIIERKASLAPNESRDFEVRVDPPVTDGTVFYRWSGTEDFGQADAAFGEDTSDTIVNYVAGDAEGTDSLHCEAFLVRNGQTESLGKADGEIRVELRKSIILGTYVYDVVAVTENTTCGAARCRVAIPDGAIRLDLRAYGHTDPSFHGSEINKSAVRLGDGRWRFGSTTNSPDDAFWNLSGLCSSSAESVTDAKAVYDGRFAAFIYEIEVTYEE